MRIFAVDDDPVILELLSGAFRQQNGYHIEFHSNAENAMEALENAEKPFDCILLDIILPGIDGIEMCQMLRRTKLHEATPILMITASTQIDLMLKAFIAGATDFITKPLNGAELGARVNTAGLLNESLSRARQAEHSLDDVTQLLKTKFIDPVALDVPRISEILEIENRLLRFQSGCFGMTLINLEIPGLRGIYRAVSAPIYRKCLETVAEVAVKSFGDKNYELAYAGKGCFVGVILTRQRISTTVFTETFNAGLQQVWQDQFGEVLSIPVGKVNLLAEQRFWSGLSASNRLRDFVDELGEDGIFSATEEDDLFSSLDNEMYVSSEDVR